MGGLCPWLLKLDGWLLKLDVFDGARLLWAVGLAAAVFVINVVVSAPS